MALTKRQIENIATDAMALYEALQAHGADDDGQADRWVGQAMMAIVMAEADQPDVTFPQEMRTDHHAPGWAADKEPPPDYGWRGGKSNVLGSIPGWPSSEQQAAKQEQLRTEQARMGNVTGKLDGLHPDMLQLLALGPEPGQEIRLVTVSVSAGNPRWSARTSPMSWVRANVPEADTITDARYAGRSESGDPVYLVTYELKAPGGPMHPITDTDVLPS